MMISYLLIGIACFLSFAVGSFVKPTIEVDASTGKYTITIDEETWFSSNEVYLHANSKLYSTGDNTLQFQSVKRTGGNDNFGLYVASTITWANKADNIVMKGMIKEYNE